MASMIGHASISISKGLERDRSIPLSSSSPIIHHHDLRHKQQSSSVSKMNNINDDDIGNNNIKTTPSPSKLNNWIAFDSSWSTENGGEGGDTEPDSTLYSNSSAESTNDENFYYKNNNNVDVVVSEITTTSTSANNGNRRQRNRNSRTPSPIMAREVMMRTPPPFPTTNNSNRNRSGSSSSGNDSPASGSSRRSSSTSSTRSRVTSASPMRRSSNSSSINNEQQMIMRRDSPPLHTSSSESSAAAAKRRSNSRQRQQQISGNNTHYNNHNYTREMLASRQNTSSPRSMISSSSGSANSNSSIASFSPGSHHNHQANNNMRASSSSPKTTRRSSNNSNVSYKKVFPFSRTKQDINSLLKLFNLEDGKVLNKYSFLCLGSTYYENFRNGDNAIRSSLLVHHNNNRIMNNNCSQNDHRSKSNDFFSQSSSSNRRMVSPGSVRCASPSSQASTQFETYCVPPPPSSSPGAATTTTAASIPSEINTTDKQVSHVQSMAVTHLLNGSYNTSIELLEEVLLFFKETFDPSNPLTVQTLHNLGNLHILSGNNGNDYDIALHYLQDAIGINRINCNNNNATTTDNNNNDNNHESNRANTLHLVSSLVKMGIANYALHQYDQSQNCFREAITCSIPLHGPNHPRVAEIFNNLACVHYERELYTLSLKILEKALEVQKKFLSELVYCDKSMDYDRNELVLGLSIIGCNIGFVYLKLKDFDKAVWALEEALNNQLLILDETDTLVMTLLDNLAFANLQRHHEEKALRTFERLLYSQVRVLGAYDIQCAITWSKMSRIYLKRHEYESSLKCIERVFECNDKNEICNQRDEFKRMERTERILQEKLELLIDRKNRRNEFTTSCIER